MSFWKLQTKFLLKHFKSIAIVFCLLLITLITHRAFFADALYKGDDFTHHSLRTASYYLALKQGQFPVRWGPNLNQGFGYPSFNYMYHTPYLLGSLFHAAGSSIQQSVNLVILLSSLGMSFFGYLYFRTISESRRIGLLLTLIYSFNPYILLTMYWRGAVGELLFYMSIPLFLFSLHKSVQKQTLSHVLMLSGITAFLVLSHIPSLILFFVIILGLLLTMYKDSLSLPIILRLGAAGILGLGLSAWYWLPAILEQNLVNYVAAGSLTQYKTQFVPFIQVFKLFTTASSSDLYSQVIQIGLPTIVILTSLIWLLLKKYVRLSRHLLTWLLIIITSLLLTTPISKPFWDSCKLIPYVQFPWRFLWPTVFASTMLLLTMFRSSQVSKHFKTYLYFLVLFTILISAITYARPKSTESRTDFDWMHPTFETGSSFDEHQPVTANFPYDFESELLYFKTNDASDEINIQSADQIINNLHLTGTKVSLDLTTDQDITIIAKRLFYPGWEAYLEEDLTEIITTTPNYEGVIAVFVPKSTKTLTLSFSGTTQIRSVAHSVSILSLTLFMILLAYSVKTEHTKKIKGFKK